MPPKRWAVELGTAAPAHRPGRRARARIRLHSWPKPLTPSVSWSLDCTHRREPARLGTEHVKMVPTPIGFVPAFPAFWLPRCRPTERDVTRCDAIGAATSD